jgi:hypothetical protein
MDFEKDMILNLDIVVWWTVNKTGKHILTLTVTGCSDTILCKIIIIIPISVSKRF